MTTVIITPCLLGFDVKTYSGHGEPVGFIRPLGIFSASDLFKNLADTPDARIILR